MNEVWKTIDHEYYTRSTKSGDRACFRKVVSWSARVDGKIVQGFGTRKAAIEAIRAEIAKLPDGGRWVS